jgi:hypothetical protein
VPYVEVSVQHLKSARRQLLRHKNDRPRHAPDPTRAPAPEVTGEYGLEAVLKR